MRTADLATISLGMFASKYRVLSHEEVKGTLIYFSYLDIG